MLGVHRYFERKTHKYSTFCHRHLKDLVLYYDRVILYSTALKDDKMHKICINLTLTECLGLLMAYPLSFSASLSLNYVGDSADVLIPDSSFYGTYLLFCL